MRTARVPADTLKSARARLKARDLRIPAVAPHGRWRQRSLAPTLIPRMHASARTVARHAVTCRRHSISGPEAVEQHTQHRLKCVQVQCSFFSVQASSLRTAACLARSRDSDKLASGVAALYGSCRRRWKRGTWLGGAGRSSRRNGRQRKLFVKCKKLAGSKKS
jgi:hypothetical protein